MSSCNYPTKSCHNCRRQRLKCDRSYPQCHKCIRTAQECLGYGELYRWNKGVASRGKMMGLTFEDGKQKKVRQVSSGTHPDKKHGDAAIANIPTSIDDSLQAVLFRLELRAELHPLKLTYPLIDPLFQDLNHESRTYLYYFAKHVCKDLVCYDVPNHNLFRDLIPLTRGDPALFHIMIAISALHMSNASRRSICRAPLTMPRLRAISSNVPPRTPFCAQSSKLYNRALLAKQIALGLIRQALDDKIYSDLEIILASVLLFVEFELINSGRDDWRSHINGARGVIDYLQSSCPTIKGKTSRMRSALISNWAVYDILGSTLTHSMPRKSLHSSSAELFSALESAETNNYLSCPAILLQLVLSATHLSHSASQNSTSTQKIIAQTPAQQISLLLLAARSFDAVVWATDLQKFSPCKDAEKRVHIASAHKAAVCIYISRASSLFSETVDLGVDLESLVSDVLHHLSFVTSDDGLFKATSWPAFIAGVETKDLASHEWAMKRLYEIWDFCPWGYIQTAVEILDMIWDKRSSGTNKSDGSMNWVQELRSLGVDWLIA